MTTTNPQRIRIDNRRKKLKKTWTGKLWKAKRLEFIKLHKGKCDWCGSTVTLTVHHPMRDAYGEEAYMDFYLSGCVLLCSKCHKATHVGKVLCDNVHEDGENHYKWHDALECGVCYNKAHPEIKTARLKKKADAKALKKKLMDDQKARVKEYKLSHKKAVKNNGVLGNGGWT